MTFSSVVWLREPLNQTVTGIFDQIFTIFPAKDRGKDGAQARLGLVQQYVW
jgi:hypothetical protein